MSPMMLQWQTPAAQAPALAAWLQVRLTSEVEKQCTLLLAKEYCGQQLKCLLLPDSAQ